MENNQHKDFDQFFQNKLNNRQFDYQDDFWAEMESQLPQSATASTVPKGESRKRLLFLLLLLVGFTTLIGWFTYPLNNNIFITKGKIVSESKSTSESMIETTVEAKDNTGLGSEFSVHTEEKAESNLSNLEQFSVIGTNNNNRSNKNSISNINLESNDLETPDKERKGSLNGENTFIIIPSSINNKIENDNFIINKNEVINNVKKGFNETLEVKPTAEYQEVNNPNINNKSISKPSNTLSKNNDNLLVSIKTKQLNLPIQGEKDRTDLTKSDCDGCPDLPPAHGFRVDLIAGLNTSLGFQNVGDRRANPSFDPSIGFRMVYHHSKTSPWKTSVGAIYSSRSALNAQIGYDSISYGFGSTIVSRSIDIEELHYISLPILAVYQYKKKHTFMGGLSFGYLLNAQSKTTGNILQMTANDTNIYAGPTTQEWGYTTAFNRFDIGTTLGYDYEVQEGWKIGARFNYGLMDVTKNSIFNNNIFDNNISLRVVMTCDLFTL